MALPHLLTCRRSVAIPALRVYGAQLKKRWTCVFLQGCQEISTDQKSTVRIGRVQSRLNRRIAVLIRKQSHARLAVCLPGSINPRRDNALDLLK